MDIQVTTIQIIVADPVEGRGYPHPPPSHIFIFQTKLRPKGPKEIFLETLPPSPPPTSLCQGLDRALNYTSSTMLSYGTVVQGGLN